MEKRDANEFEAVLDINGRIAVPSDLRAKYTGTKVHVRLEKKTIADHLKKKNVTEEEIDRISAMQLETREQVVKFLLSQGALSRSTPFKKRLTRFSR